MQVSGTNITQLIPVTETNQTPSKEEENETPPIAENTQTTEEEEDSQAVYWIGSEIVSETIFNKYDTNGDGIISEAEKVAYERDKAQNDAEDGNLDIIA
jgi:hypothetical protein